MTEFLLSICHIPGFLITPRWGWYYIPLLLHGLYPAGLMTGAPLGLGTAFRLCSWAVLMINDYRPCAFGDE